jgi:hypothetical protein
MLSIGLAAFPGSGGFVPFNQCHQLDVGESRLGDLPIIVLEPGGTIARRTPIQNQARPSAFVFNLDDRLLELSGSFLLIVPFLSSLCTPGSSGTKSSVPCL